MTLQVIRSVLVTAANAVDDLLASAPTLKAEARLDVVAVKIDDALRAIDQIEREDERAFAERE